LQHLLAEDGRWGVMQQQRWDAFLDWLSGAPAGLAPLLPLPARFPAHWLGPEAAASSSHRVDAVPVVGCAARCSNTQWMPLTASLVLPFVAESGLLTTKVQSRTAKVCGLGLGRLGGR
jgi:hypothetical protein